MAQVNSSKLESIVIALLFITVICAMLAISSPVTFQGYGYAALVSGVIAGCIFLYVAISASRQN